MAIEITVTSSKVGAALSCSGVSADLITPKEVDEAVKLVMEKLHLAACEAKQAIQNEKRNSAYS